MDPNNFKADAKTSSGKIKSEIMVNGKTKTPYKMEIVWINVVVFIILHSLGFYGVWMVFTEFVFLELILGIMSGIIGGIGVTAGAHRLWSHRAYKAKLPLRIFLMLCQSHALQNDIYVWTRDHRVHHKFTDTDADPHNSKRGFFFAHMGWLMCKKHPDVMQKGKQIDMSDVLADPVVRFQKKYYFFIMPICFFVIPCIIPYFILGSSIRVCFFVCCMVRYCLSLHLTWLVNSAAHFYGTKPFDQGISSVESKFVADFAFGEGWHNYHHVFPWDYKAAELGNFQHNWTTGFLNIMAKIGQAYDLKTASREMILRRVQRTGDGSHYSLTDVNSNLGNKSEAITNEMIMKLDHDHEKTLIWGWDDKDILEDDRNGADIIERIDSSEGISLKRKH